MLEWLSANLATVLISAALLAVIAVIVVRLKKNKKSGKGSCGCGCSECAMRGMCHSADSDVKSSDE